MGNRKIKSQVGELNQQDKEIYFAQNPSTSLNFDI